MEMSEEYPIRRIKAREEKPHHHEMCRVVIEVEVPVLDGEQLTIKDQEDIKNEILSSLEAEGIYGSFRETETRRG